MDAPAVEWAAAACHLFLLLLALWRVEVLTRYSVAASSLGLPSAAPAVAAALACTAAGGAHAAAAVLCGGGWQRASLCVAAAAYAALGAAEWLGRATAAFAPLAAPRRSAAACAATAAACAVSAVISWYEGSGGFGGGSCRTAGAVALGSAAAAAAAVAAAGALPLLSGGGQSSASCSPLLDAPSGGLHVQEAPLNEGQPAPATASEAFAAAAAEDRAGWGSLLSFAWVGPVMRRGSAAFLEPADLAREVGLPYDLATGPLAGRFARRLAAALDARAAASGSGALWRALVGELGPSYFPLGIVKLVADVAGFAQPLLLHRLISQLEDGDESSAEVMCTAGALSGAALAQSLLNSQYNYRCARVRVSLSTCIVTSVFRKALRCNLPAAGFSSGEVVNVMSTDADRIAGFGAGFHQFWSMPFQIAVSLYLLYRQVGVAFLAGLAFAIVLIPINRELARRIGKLSAAMMQAKDARVKVVSELLHGIRVVKQYAWEEHFEAKVGALREEEVRSLKGRKYLDAWCVYFWATTPIVISILTFSTYSLLGNDLRAATVFTSMALFNMLIGPLNSFPWVLNGLVESLVSLRRVDRFLIAPNVGGLCGGGTEQAAVRVRGGCFAWPPADQRLVLRSVELTAAPGELLGVSGAVGAGKSSLLMALLGEMTRVEGEVCVSEGHAGGVGYASQEGWVRNGTIRDNVLCGAPYEEGWYRAVLSACALDHDIRQLPGGDLAAVGDNGATLSGGQRARVSLARAVYQRKAVYLLDDVTAALDQRVAEHVFEHCIQGLLRDKTRIFCSHSPGLLRRLPRVVRITDGTLEEGLANCSKGEAEGPGDGAAGAGQEQEPPQAGQSCAPPEPSEQREEERSVGAVKLGVYRAYGAAVGGCLTAAVLIAMLLMQGSRNATDLWLSHWVRAAAGDGAAACTSTRCFLTVYAALGVANSLCALVRAYSFAYAGVRAARSVHNRLLAAVLYAPTSFFDETPIGRVVNRFSSDVYGVDDSLPFIMNILLANIYGLAGSLAVTLYGLPYFGIVLVPVGVIYYRIQHFYRQSSREVKRLANISRSPVYALLAETLSGAVTLRAMSCEDRIEQEVRQRLDASQLASFTEQAVNQWLGFRLQMLGAIMVAGVSLLAAGQYGGAVPGRTDAGLVGLSLTYALSVTGLLGGLVTSFTETEKEMVNVERAEQYTAIHPEPGRRNAPDPAAEPPGEWPQRGELRFEEATLAYGDGLPPALRAVSFTVPAGAKIGVVGRTGAGKSSLLRALFRLTPLSGGRVVLDGIDIATVPLRILRQRLAAIPQEPVLFGGSLRENVDPFREHSDEEVWQALGASQLREAVLRLPRGVEEPVAERGANFSVGQRQLVCLARALLRRARVVAVDEATASVDHATDLEVQGALRSSCATATVVTVAHRVSTVMDSDLVLVMDAGTVAEIGAPRDLLECKGTRFAELCGGYSQ
eukprot:TRINITY_DN6263_c1_g1_i1.p1 TRINITY_DN6263_c1_g1~~TRINITY_DN6263_c1_g1_i1.p1  ORF type:complete len:1471 (+),score=387.48 TRINITY_DN6263_c1_g1_i1:72-4415(+)